MVQVLGSKGGIQEFEEPLRSQMKFMLEDALTGKACPMDSSFFEIALMGHIMRFAEGKLSSRELSHFFLGHARLRQVSVDVTNQCNLHCSHCFYSAEAGQDISIDKWADILEQIYDLGVRTVTIAGREPFISPITIEVMKKLYTLKKRGRHPFQFGVVTNGTLLFDYLEEMSLLDMDYLDISIDGLRETHDIYRGKGNFDRSLRGLRKAIALNAARKIFVASILHQENFKEIPRLVEHFSKEGVCHFVLGLFFPTPETPEYLILKKETLPFFLDELEENLQVLDLNRPIEVVIEISMMTLSYLPQLFDLGVICFDNIFLDKAGNFYTKKTFANGAKLFIQFPPFMEETYWSVSRIKNGYYLGGCEPLVVKRGWEKYAVGNILTEPMHVLFKRSLEVQLNEILNSIDNSICRGKPCFKYCLGGDHLYRVIMGESEVDYVCQRRQETQLQDQCYPPSITHYSVLGM